MNKDKNILNEEIEKDIEEDTDVESNVKIGQGFIFDFNNLHDEEDDPLEFSINKLNVADERELGNYANLHIGEQAVILPSDAIYDAQTSNKTIEVLHRSTEQADSKITFHDISDELDAQTKAKQSSNVIDQSTVDKINVDNTQLINLTGKQDASLLFNQDFDDPTKHLAHSQLGEGAYNIDTNTSLIEQLSAEGRIRDINLEDLDNYNLILGNKFAADVLVGTDANDILLGFGGDDVLIGGKGDDIIVGGSGNDVLVGGFGDDVLLGGSGSDVLDGGFGNDVLIGDGSIDDLLLELSSKLPDSALDVLFKNADTVSLAQTLSDGADVVQIGSGGAGNDLLIGGAGDDLLIGGAGDDNLLGGAGRDILIGGAGEDTLIADENDIAEEEIADEEAIIEEPVVEGEPVVAAETIVEQPVVVAEPVVAAETIVEQPVVVAEPAVAAETIVEQPVVVAEPVVAAETIVEQPVVVAEPAVAVETIVEQPVVVAEPVVEAETIVEQPVVVAEPVVEAGAIIEDPVVKEQPKVEYDDNRVEADGTQSSEDWDNILFGGKGDDKLTGSSENDYISGGAGEDTLIGGKGDDALDGGSGDDKLEAGVGDDYLYGGHGDDTLKGGTGDDHLFGGAGNDTLKGGSGDDVLYGGAGNDEVYGDAGNDVFVFSHGQDTFHGGAGSDSILLAADEDIAITQEGRSSWNIEVDGVSGHIEANHGATLDGENLIFAKKSSGTITMDNGDVLHFDNVESIAMKGNFNNNPPIPLLDKDSSSGDWTVDVEKIAEKHAEHDDSANVSADYSGAIPDSIGLSESQHDTTGYEEHNE